MSNITQYLHDLAGLVFATSCVSCESAGQVLCSRCRNEISAPSPTIRMLLDNFSRDGPLTLSVGADYRAATRSCILAFKRSGSGECGDALVPLAASAIRHTVVDSAVIVPIPSGRATRSKSGVDVAHYFASRARQLNRKHDLDVPVVSLFKARWTGRMQKGQSAAARLQNADNLIRLDRNRVNALKRDRGPSVRVVLFDDVATTGATLLAARAAVRASGLHVGAAAVIAGVTPRG